MEVIEMMFQDKLQVLRKEKGISQEKLAENRCITTGCGQMGSRPILSDMDNLIRSATCSGLALTG